MINRQQALLIKLSEECTELSQRASKSIRFGLSEVEPGQDKDNLTRLADEFFDVITVVEILLTEHPELREKFSVSSDTFPSKKSRLDKYMKYSQELGIIEWEPKSTNQNTQKD